MSTAKLSEHNRTGDQVNRPIVKSWDEFADNTVYQLQVLICLEEDGGYSAEALNLPGVVSQGEDIPETVANIREAAEGALASYKAHGENAPWTKGPVRVADSDRQKDSRELWILVNA